VDSHQSCYCMDDNEARCANSIVCWVVDKQATGDALASV